MTRVKGIKPFLSPNCFQLLLYYLRDIFAFLNQYSSSTVAMAIQ